MHLHILEYVSGAIILEMDLEPDHLNELLEQVETDLVEMLSPRTDFIFSVFRGTELGFYSDVNAGHSDYLPATRHDVRQYHNLVKRIAGKSQAARAQLNELVVCEYFRQLGYDSELAGADLDKLKIDVCAENDHEAVFCQVKLGEINKSSMAEVVSSVSNLPSEKSRCAAVVAERFPPDIEAFARNLADETGIHVWYIFKAQVVQTLPRYRNALTS